MKICIVGAGSIGGVIASRLHRKGDVTAVLRGENLEAVKKNGYQIVGDRGTTTTAKVKATDNLKIIGKQDLIILSVKAHQIKEIVNDLEHIIHNQSIIVTMQNGIPWWYFKKFTSSFSIQHVESVDPKGFIASNIDADKIIGGVVYMAAEKVKPGVIKSIENEKISFGELDGSYSNRLRNICQMFVESGIKAPIKKDIRSEIWIKLMGNCTLNPISAISQSTLSEICQSVQGRDLLYKMCCEVKNIGETFGAKFKVSIEDRIKAAENVGHHKTSMLQDIEHGRQTELEALLGSVLELGKIAKLKTPYLESLYACCSLLDSKLQQTSSFLKIREG
ncbi:MAG: hypothetical protein CBC01_06350 [Betaproteobacteria bacterium TMED41]|nr:MAG: hypothetical protein CBC01_06350 [Betaproteobacteria bacterium TMED41]|tara:strand:+ start:34 stop:1035 length:1002 start_codon:yes stop_codon:yes gene_type:complete